jgi:autotransporter-associated beta strand protein
MATGLVTSAAGLMLLASPVSASSLTWNGLTNGLWGTSTNWNPNATPGLSDDLTILGPSNVAGALTINVAAAAAANTINLTNTAATTLSNTTSGSNQTLTLGAGITTGSGALTIGSATANQNVNVALGASQTWNVGSGGMTVNNVVSDGGSAFGLTKTGSGTLTLAGANTYTGTTTLNQGTLTLSGSISSSSPLALGGGTLNYTKAGTNTQTFASTTVNSGFSTVTNATATNTVALGTITRNSGGMLNVSSLTGSTTTSSAVDSTGILGTWATTGNGTSLSYAAGGSGSAITAYSAGTSVADATGVTDTTGAVNYNVAAVGALGTGASFNTLRYTGVAGTITGNFTANGLMNAGSTGPLVYSGNVTIGANKELVITGNTLGTTISGIIANNGGGASSVTYGGPSAGALTLSGVNTYSGGTTLNSGTLLIQGNSTPTTNGSTITSGPLGTGALTLNGGTFGFSTAGTSYTIANNATVAGATTIEVASGTNEILNGNWSGSGNLTLVGNGSTGQWQFGGNNSGYTGTFTENAGNSSLAFNSVNSGSANANWVFNNPTNQRTRLNFGTGTINFGSLAGNGSIANVFASGTSTMSVGALNTSTTFSGIIGGSSVGQGQNIALTKIGTGVLTLSGANTYTAGTTITAGKLSVTGSTSTTGAVTLNGGTSATLAGTGTVGGAVTATAGSRIAPGIVTPSSNFGSAGTLTLSSASGLTLTSANLDFDLATTAAGTSDKIALGTSNLSFSTLQFNFSGTNLEMNNPYTLITTTGSLSAGNTAAITTDFTNVTSGNYFAFYNFVAGTGLQVTFSAIPESHGFAIAIVGLLCAVVIIRRRKLQEI